MQDLLSSTNKNLIDHLYNTLFLIKLSCPIFLTNASQWATHYQLAVASQTWNNYCILLVYSTTKRRPFSPEVVLYYINADAAETIVYQQNWFYSTNKNLLNHSAAQLFAKFNHSVLFVVPLKINAAYLICSQHCGTS